MITNQLIEKKFKIINKSCIGWEDIKVLLDLKTDSAAKITFRKFKSNHRENPYISKRTIPLSIIEKDLANMGVNFNRIIKLYSLINNTKKDISMEWLAMLVSDLWYQILINLN